jgi:hypothetical protein
MTEAKQPIQLPAELLQSIEEFKSRRKYASFDLATLRGIKDDHIEQALLDYLFDIALKGRDRRSALLGLSRGFQVVYMTWIVEAEVLNGGFNQYFWNSSGEFADLTPAALREIGATEAAPIMQNALKIAHSGDARDGQIARSQNTGSVLAVV